jgi:hypothetical protein
MTAWLNAAFATAGSSDANPIATIADRFQRWDIRPSPEVN